MRVSVAASDEARRIDSYAINRLWRLIFACQGSGSPACTRTTEDGLALSLSKLLRDRFFRHGRASGSLIWTNTTTGERVASIGYDAHLGGESGRVRLYYTTTRSDGQRHESDYWIQLVTTPQLFGGRR